MINATFRPANPKLIVRGIHLDLGESMSESAKTKVERLFRHEPRIIRLRIDVELDHRGGIRCFTAKGHVEIRGADLQACVTSEDAYRSINLLVDKLDRMLRRRTTAMRSRRFEDDIRAHPGFSGGQ